MRILEREREGKAVPLFGQQSRLWRPDPVVCKRNPVAGNVMPISERGTEIRSGMPDPKQVPLFNAVQSVQPTERSGYQTIVFLEFQGSLPVLVA
jgi:hypothetical protein